MVDRAKSNIYTEANVKHIVCPIGGVTMKSYPLLFAHDPTQLCGTISFTEDKADDLLRAIKAGAVRLEVVGDNKGVLAFSLMPISPGVKDFREAEVM